MKGGGKRGRREMQEADMVVYDGRSSGDDRGGGG